MSQQQPDGGKSGLEKTARFFRRHRRKWHSAFLLMRVGGQLAWRTKVSQCRTHRGMNIEWNENRKRSKYRYVGRLRAA